MFFEHIYDSSLSQASYLIGCQQSGEAMVIDPRRDVDIYVELAKKQDLRITHIAETHIHADFLTGSRELAAITGATMYLSDEGGADWQYAFAHHGLRHGDIITLGNLTFEVFHTPGHTPESISMLLTDHAATDCPVMIFTGDFVFVGDVGRPDLLEAAAGITGSARWGAAQLYTSLQHFRTLPDYIQLWPGHGAGSSCGKALGAVPGSTIGYEKIRNWALNIPEENLFVDELLQGQPEPPVYFAEMKIRNKEDRPLLLQVPQVSLLTPREFARYNEDEHVQVIDTRSRHAYAEAHVAGTLNIPFSNSFATWCGWMINYTDPIVLVVEEQLLEEVLRNLMRIGLDQVVGYITTPDFSHAGISSGTVINREELQQRLRQADGVQLLDVRSASEFKRGHIPGAQHFFVGSLPGMLDQLSSAKPTIVYCQSGDRAAIAASFLRKQGFERVEVYFGGMKEWQEQVPAA